MKYIQHGDTRTPLPLSEEETRGLRKYFALVVEAHHVGCALRELSDDSRDLHQRIAGLRNSIAQRAPLHRYREEAERDRISHERMIAIAQLRKEIVEASMEILQARVVGLQDQRDRIRDVLREVGQLSNEELRT